MRPQRFKNLFTFTMVLAMTFSLSACFGRGSTEDYADKKPVADVRQFFNGKLQAWGTLTNFGKTSRTFHADMEGKFDSKGGELNEIFHFDDGEIQTRTWKITFTDDHHFTATAGDVIGVAEGTQHGNAINMKYTLRVKRSNGKEIDLSMDDWMFVTTNGQVMNLTTMNKFGFKVGQLSVAIRKVD